MGFFVYMHKYTTFLPPQDNPPPLSNARAGPGHSSAAVVVGAGAHARVVTMATAVHCARILTAGDGGPPFYFPPLSPSHHPAAVDNIFHIQICIYIYIYVLFIIYIIYIGIYYDLACTALARGRFAFKINCKYLG